MSEYTDPATEPLSLDQQLALFDDRIEASLQLLRDIVNSHEMGPVVEIARIRLEMGLHTYGDAMFRFSEEERRCNIIEELADALNYIVSGPIVETES